MAGYNPSYVLDLVPERIMASLAAQVLGWRVNLPKYGPHL